MPDTAEAHSHILTTNRNCTIEITNVTGNFCLVNPQVHMEKGFPYSPPQPTIRNTHPEICSFTKDDNTATGAVGVLTYQVFDMRTRSCSELMAVMFSVPFDYNIYKNWLAVGVYPASQKTDHGLYEEMYEKKDPTKFVRQEADGSGLVFEGKMVDVRAFMSNECKAIVKLELYDKMG